MSGRLFFCIVPIVVAGNFCYQAISLIENFAEPGSTGTMGILLFLGRHILGRLRG